MAAVPKRIMAGQLCSQSKLAGKFMISKCAAIAPASMGTNILKPAQALRPMPIAIFVSRL